MSSNQTIAQTNSTQSANAQPVTATPAGDDKEAGAVAVFHEGLPEGPNDAEAADRVCESNQNSGEGLRGDDDLLPSEAEAQSGVSPTPAAQSPSPAQTEQSPLEVPNLQITEIRRLASNVPGYLAGRLRAEVTLKLSDSLREFAENRIPYVTEAHLVNTQTRQSTMVASRVNHLINDNFIYEIKLDFPLPAVGLYQSYVIARLLPPGEGTVQVKGPIINVEP